MVAVFAVILASGLLTHQAGAKSLFHQWSTDFVGINYWFEDARGQRLTAASAARTDASVTLHIRGNVSAFLTVWAVDGAVLRQLTPLHPDPRVSGQGRWSGLILAANEEYVVPGSVSAGSAPHLAIVYCRSQTEQAHSEKQVMETLNRHIAYKAADGSSAILTEVQTDGSYVVNRTGGCAVTEIVFESRR